MERPKELIRKEIIRWQDDGLCKMPALAGAEKLLAMLEAEGWAIVPKSQTDYGSH